MKIDKAWKNILKKFKISVTLGG